ncbi:MAG: tetratricopeptide repeat protein [Promethearchaeota archaeon]
MPDEKRGEERHATGEGTWREVREIQREIEEHGDEMSSEERVLLLGKAGYLLLDLADEDSSAIGEAVEVFRQAAGEFEKLGDGRGLGSALATIALAYQKAGELEKSTGEFVRAIETFSRASGGGSYAEVLECMKGIGLNHLRAGDDEGAIQQFEQARSLAEEIGDTGNLLDCYANLVHIHEDLKNWEEMVELYAKVLPLFEELGDAGGLVTTLLNLAYLLSKLEVDSPEKYPRGRESAKNYLKRALALARREKLELEGARVHERLGELAFQDGDIEGALEHFRAALATYKEAASREDALRLVVAIHLLGGDAG